MKLKYYLRGLGIGILFATIMMTISSVIHKNDISDEEIIKRAQKLGMVMEEDTNKENDLWGSTEDTETGALPESAEGTEQSPSTESEIGQDSQSQNVTPQDSQSQNETSSEKESESLPEKETEKESEKTSEKESEKEKPTKTEKKDYIRITISDTDAARHVSEKLAFGGLVKSAEDFLAYLRKHGYATSILSGTFDIPVGASYKEICDIIVNK